MGCRLQLAACGAGHAGSIAHPDPPTDLLSSSKMVALCERLHHEVVSCPRGFVGSNLDLRSKYSVIDAVAMLPDATLGSTLFSVTASGNPLARRPAIARADDGTLWLAWVDGTSAKLGSIDSTSVLTVRRAWNAADQIWLVSTTGGITAAIADAAGNLQIAHDCY